MRRLTELFKTESESYAIAAFETIEKNELGETLHIQIVEFYDDHDYIKTLKENNYIDKNIKSIFDIEYSFLDSPCDLIDIEYDHPELNNIKHKQRYFDLESKEEKERIIRDIIDRFYSSSKNIYIEKQRIYKEEQQRRAEKYSKENGNLKIYTEIEESTPPWCSFYTIDKKYKIKMIRRGSFFNLETAILINNKR